MWRLLLICLASLSLTGCAVSIDPQTAIPDEDSSMQQQPKNEMDSSDKEDTSKNFINFIEDVFHLDWSTGKDTNAQDIHYLAFGDSLTRGVGDELKNYGYTIRLQEQLEKWPMIKKVELDNRGKNGRRSDQLLALLEKGHYDEELEQANLITITLGGNDAMKVVKGNLFALKKSMFDKELPKFKERYEQIVLEIRKRNPDVPIVYIGFYNPFSIVVDEITPFEPIISEWNDVIEQVATQDVNACFVSVDDLFTSNEDMVYHVDFFHPNSAGYDRMAKRIIETMQTCEIEEMSDGLIGIEEWEHE